MNVGEATTAVDRAFYARPSSEMIKVSRRVSTLDDSRLWDCKPYCPTVCNYRVTPRLATSSRRIK